MEYKIYPNTNLCNDCTSGNDCYSGCIVNRNYDQFYDEAPTCNLNLGLGTQLIRYSPGNWTKWIGPSGITNEQTCPENMLSLENGVCLEGYIGNGYDSPPYPGYSTYGMLNVASDPLNVINITTTDSVKSVNILQILSGLSNMYGGDNTPIASQYQTINTRSYLNLSEPEYNAPCCMPFNTSLNPDPTKNACGLTVLQHRESCSGDTCQKTAKCNNFMTQYCLDPNMWKTTDCLSLNFCQVYYDHIFGIDNNAGSPTVDQASLESARGAFALYKIQSILTNNNNIFTNFTGQVAVELDAAIEHAAMFSSSAYNSLISDLCTGVTAQNLNQGSHTAKLCGCNMNTIQYQQYSQFYGTISDDNQKPISCSPQCSLSSIKKYVDGSPTPDTCDQTLCILNDFSINVGKSNFGNNQIDLTQLCQGTTSDYLCEVGQINVEGNIDILNKINLNENCNVCAVYNDQTILYPQFIDCNQVTKYLQINTT
jgi:hypothetical protein